MSENIEILAGIMKCEYEKINETSDKQKMIERYFELWEDGKENGYTPVFVKVEDFFIEEFPEVEEYEKFKSEILKKYEEIDCNKWFKDKKEEYLENDYLQDEYKFSNNSDYLDYFKNFDENKTLNLASIFDEETKKLEQMWHYLKFLQIKFMKFQDGFYLEDLMNVLYLKKLFLLVNTGMKDIRQELLQ